MRKHSRFVLPILVGIIGLRVLPALSHAIADDAEGGKQAKTVEEVCAPILEARRGLRTGEMLIIRESRTMRDGKKDGRQSMLHLWFDGDKRRLEELHEPFTLRNGKESPRNTENTCRGCYSDTTLVWHSLNKPLDPAVFSLKGIRSITPGVFVHRESKDRDSNFFNDQTVTIDGREIHRATAVWNGEKLVSREEFEISGNLP